MVSNLHLGLKCGPIGRDKGSAILIITKLTVRIGGDLLKVKRWVSTWIRYARVIKRPIDTSGRSGIR